MTVEALLGLEAVVGGSLQYKFTSARTKGFASIANHAK